MTQESQTDKNENQNDQRLEAIKELLFGQNVQEYRDEFRELKDQIKSQSKKSEEKNSELDSILSERIDQLESKVNEQFTAMNKRIEDGLAKLTVNTVDKKSLSSILIDIAQRLDK